MDLQQMDNKTSMWAVLLAIAMLCPSPSVGHPAKFHKKVTGEIQTGRIVKASDQRILLNIGEVALPGELKVTRIEKVAKPRDLEEFVFVEYAGGELTELPPWFPREFRVGDTSAAGVLRRSRQNPDLHFIQANRRMFRLPTDRGFAVWKHVELKGLPSLQEGQKVLVICGEKDGQKVAGAVCVFPTPEKDAQAKE